MNKTIILPWIFIAGMSTITTPAFGMPSADTSAIAGLWNASHQDNQHVTKIRFIRITANAQWETIEYNKASKCYTVTLTNVSSLGDNLYQIGYTRTQAEVDNGISDAILLTIVADATHLSVYGTDTIDFNLNGKVGESIQQTWMLSNNIQPTFVLC